MDDIRYQAFISDALDNNPPSRLPGPDGSRRGRVQVFHDQLPRELVGNAALPHPARERPLDGRFLGPAFARRRDCRKT